MCIGGVGIAALSGSEYPGARRRPGRHVHDVLPAGDQTPGDMPTRLCWRGHLHNGSALVHGRHDVTDRHGGREFSVVVRAESAMPGTGRPAPELG
jgi:hypothetical protein